MRFFIPCLLIFLFSCEPGGGGGGQHACLPTGPMVGVFPPPSAQLDAYVDELEAESYARWPHDSNLPSIDALESLGVRDRQLVTYRYFYPEGDTDLAGSPRDLSLTTFRGPELHLASAQLVASALGLGFTIASTAESEGRTTYFLEPQSPQFSKRQMLWMANRALELFPQCFLHGGVWDLPHGQGGGGAI